MARFSAPDCRPVLGAVKARPCGRPAAGLDRSCTPAVIWCRRRIGHSKISSTRVSTVRGEPRFGGRRSLRNHRSRTVQMPRESS